MNFTNEDRKNLLECVKKDTKWLSKQKLIDYSLLIGVEKIEDNDGDIEKNTSGKQRSQTKSHRRPDFKFYSPDEFIKEQIALIDKF